ncbi:hypothetical protein LOD75_11265 [Xylella fastidiosa subsp. multiplex]|nr:hypothetical protein [Xylella fastidiosa]MDD0910487.1 hypothetical protein [Xylella fastidiosa subsp. multiplex]
MRANPKRVAAKTAILGVKFPNDQLAQDYIWMQYYNEYFFFHADLR